MGDKYTVKSDLSVAAKHATAIDLPIIIQLLQFKEMSKRQLLVIIVPKLVLVNLRIFRLSYRIIL